VIGQPSRDAECKSCGAPFIRYNTIQRLCRDCSISRAKKLAPAKAQLRRAVRVIEMQGQARSGTPLKPISMKQRKPIKQVGKVQRQDAIFRDKVVRPYLEKNFGIACAECGVMPPMLDSGEFSRHAIDHIKGKGPHPELRFVITNFQFLCVPCHQAKTGVPMWTPKMVA
jgi:5-methylcytosine-specific restriction endonuclease McrA